MSFSYYSEVILPVKPNLQDTHYDCGAASLEIILQTLGKSISEEELMKLSETSIEDGASPKHLMRVLNKLGVRYELIPDGSIELIEEKIKLLNICLVVYQMPGYSDNIYKKLEAGHYSVIFGYNKENFWIADPAAHREIGHTHKYRAGIHEIEKGQFNKRWIDIGGDHVIYRHWMLCVPLAQIAFP